MCIYNAETACFTRPLTLRTLPWPDGKARPVRQILRRFMSSSAKAGSIELIVGPMFAGKTTELLERIERAERAGKKCVVLKPAIDTRSPDVRTHNSKAHAAVVYEHLMPHVGDCRNYEVIGIDEAQFFSDVVEFSEAMANLGSVVIVSGLDGDYKRRPFGRILELIAGCASFVKMSAINCATGEQASFTHRTVLSDQLELIGGAESYEPANRACFVGHETKGEIHLVFGPRMRGKTTELVGLLKAQVDAKQRVVMVCAEGIGGVPFEVWQRNSLPAPEEVAGFDVIGVDDANSFENIAEWADALANSGKLVELAALDGDKVRKTYPNIVKLVPLCEKARKLD